MAHKTLKFPPKMTETRKSDLTAIVWATMQQPGKTWRSPEITSDISQYLHEQGYTLVTNKLTDQLKWLHDEGYGIVVINGRRTQEFLLDGDVQLAEDPAFIRAKRAHEDRAKVEAKINAVLDAHRKVKPTLTLPLPTPKSPAWEQPLITLLRNYWRDEPEEATQWAEQVIFMLTERGIETEKGS